MTKTDYQETIGTLLCLDRNMTKDLGNLSIETLSKMYVNYIQNAKDYNNKLERVMEAAYKKGAEKHSKSDVAKAAHRA